VPLLLLGPPFFLIILFLSTTLLTWMTGISLHAQWPLASQSHGRRISSLQNAVLANSSLHQQNDLFLIRAKRININYSSGSFVCLKQCDKKCFRKSGQIVKKSPNIEQTCRGSCFSENPAFFLLKD
jgi:hypothetical protein